MAAEAASGGAGGSGAAATEPPVTFVSKDKHEFSVPYEVAQMSEFAKMQLDVIEGDEPVNIMNVDKETLGTILEWCGRHVDKPFPELEKPLKSTKLTECGISEEDDKWIHAFEYDALQRIIEAANYMGISSLLTLASARCALWFRGRTPQDIKNFFGVKRDFTNDEEAEVRAKYPWAENLGGAVGEDGREGDKEKAGEGESKA